VINNVSICTRGGVVSRMKVVFNAAYKFDVNGRVGVAVDESSKARKVLKVLTALHAGDLIVCVHALVCARARDYIAKNTHVR
jgi:hypothetical protein